MLSIRAVLVGWVKTYTELMEGFAATFSVLFHDFHFEIRHFSRDKDGAVQG